MYFFIMKMLVGHIAFGSSICPSVTLFDACRILRTVHARVLKFHLWIPYGKIANPHLFSCPSYIPFWSYAPLKKSEWNLMHAISYEPCMLGFWNFIYGFLMVKKKWPMFFSLVPSYLFIWSYAPLKKSDEILSARYCEKYLS